MLTLWQLLKLKERLSGSSVKYCGNVLNFNGMRKKQLICSRRIHTKMMMVESEEKIFMFCDIF